MVNALFRKTSLTLGPIILETLLKHYFDRFSKDHGTENMTRLRREELLYDEAFNIIKSFMEAATKHTVEELQEFSNTRTPSPPWVHVVRLLVPMSCCDEAADVLIKVLGGEEMTKRVVGGTKWWQVRGVKGVDAEWIVAKKDWQEAKKKAKARGMSTDGPSVDSGNPSQEMPPEYQPEMDEMRCVLYAHGGGYYFGSFDQERYSIQRLARKINGRVFAINYRLAPQYPFPCAIQDFIAAYLYLLRPPPGSLHTPVAPSKIVFAGDSAGGGLCIAALQVVRDAGLPLPAGGVLISPWCDLTHSFPSIHTNTATDIIPPTGLSFHKPSTLWPPPPDEVTSRVHKGLRERIRQAVRPTPKTSSTKDGKLDVPPSDPDPNADPHGLPSRASTPDYSVPVSASSGRTLNLHLGGAGSFPLAMSADGVRSQRVKVVTSEGEELSIDGQVHMYAPNYLVTHPLVSPVVSYLGGLPPLLVIASDGEVLRDEIIYLAHKAAHPDKYPVKPEARLLYPPLQGIEERHGPTKVHLQVWDDCAHTLPILFAFTTPGKYCFRAMATFIKYVTGMPPQFHPKLDIPMTPTIVPEAPVTASPASTQVDLSRLPHKAEEGQNQGGSGSSWPTSGMSTFKSDPSIAASGSASELSPPSASASTSTSIASDSTTKRASTGMPPVSTSGLAAAQVNGSGNGTVHFHDKGGTDEHRAVGGHAPKRAPSMDDNLSLRRRLSSSVTRASGFLRRNQSATATSGATRSGAAGDDGRKSTGESDVGGPRFHHLQHDSVSGSGSGSKSAGAPGIRRAGMPEVYENGLDTMIRERVATNGVVRALEPEAELDAFRLPPELIGELSELAVRRYIDGTAKFGKKFGKTVKAIEKAREKNYKRAVEDVDKRMAQLQTLFNTGGSCANLLEAGEVDASKEGEGAGAEREGSTVLKPESSSNGVKEGLAAQGSWPWAWALDADEHPPPSSIVSRRDTEEARRLAKVADQAVFMDESAMSGNNLWQLMVNFLTVTPDRDGHDAHQHKHKHKPKHGHKHDLHHDQEKKGEDDEDGARHSLKTDHTLSGLDDKEQDPAGVRTSPDDGAASHSRTETIPKREKMGSRFARLVMENRKSRNPGTSQPQSEQ